MLQLDVICTYRATRRWLQIGGLVVLLSLFLPSMAFAESPDPEYKGPETCAQCHPQEAAIWGDSPHAHALETIEAALQTAGDGSPALEDSDCIQCHTTDYVPGEAVSAHAGVTCEACHGPYVQGHPQNGVMSLKDEASTCRDCHSTTYEQWHETPHAEAAVQCTSCHTPHEQQTRLDKASLCESCHRDDAEHGVHHEAGVHCADCHLPSPSSPDSAGDVRVMAGGKAPGHSFELAVEACAGCHAESIHENAPAAASHQIETAQVADMQERARELANALEDARRSNRTLQTMSVVSLGFGLGTGGVLGVIFVLVVGFIAQGRARR